MVTSYQFIGARFHAGAGLGGARLGTRGVTGKGELHFLAPPVILRSDRGLESLTELLTIHSTSPRQTHRIRISGSGLQESELLPSSRAPPIGSIKSERKEVDLSHLSKALVNRWLPPPVGAPL